MLPLFLTVLFFFGCCSAQTLDDCPAGLERDEYLQLHGSSCFLFVLHYALDYNTALEDCKTHGGTLVLDKSQDITDFLIDQLVYVYGDASDIWIGLNDKNSEGVYEWEDGTPLSGYQNWGATSGNGTSNFHDCVYFNPSKNGEWQEDFCSNLLWDFFVYERPYVCQYRTRGSTSAP